jgi:hypothetical protein
LKISYNNLGGTMGNTILVNVYGTAVTFKDWILIKTFFKNRKLVLKILKTVNIF